MKKNIYWFIIVLIFSFTANAQNKMLLVTGKKIDIGSYKIGESDYLSYKNEKGKTKSINKQDIFSIKEENGKETVIYVPNAEDSTAFTVEQMRDFVTGAYDARTNYKTPLITSVGLVVGGGSVGLTAAGMSTLLVPVLPVVYTSGIGIFKAKKEKLKLPENLKTNEYYTAGYLQRVNRKRVNHAIIGTLIGIAVGTVGVITFAK